MATVKKKCSIFLPVADGAAVVMLKSVGWAVAVGEVIDVSLFAVVEACVNATEGAVGAHCKTHHNIK